MCNSIDLSDHLGLVLLWLSVFALCGCVPIMLLPRADGIFDQPICEHAFFFSLLVPLIVCNDIVNKTNLWLNFCQSRPDVAEFSELKKVGQHSLQHIVEGFAKFSTWNRGQQKPDTQIMHPRIGWLGFIHFIFQQSCITLTGKASRVLLVHTALFKSSLQGNFCYSRLATIKTTEINLTWRKRTNIAYFPQLWNLTHKPSSWCWW